MDEYTADQATHKLACVHAQGRSRKQYTMKCIKLGETKAGKVKVLVFGRLFWRDTEHVKAIRYVEPDRLIAIDKPSFGSPLEHRVGLIPTKGNHEY